VVGFVRSHLDQLASDRIFATGIQLYLEHRGEVLISDAWGDCAGLPIEIDSVHPAYCATKPLLALVVGHLIDRSAIDGTTVLSELDRELSWVGPHVTVAQILSHQAGMREPNAALWRMTPPTNRHELLTAFGIPDGATATYSEFAGWLALGKACEAAVGEPIATLVQDLVLGRLGVAGILVSGDAAIRAGLDGRVRVPMDGLPHSPVPLLSEQLECQLAESSPSFGGMVTMDGLGTVYTAVKRVLQGGLAAGIPSRSALEQMLEWRRERVWDPVIRRRCAFAGGFMVDLSDFGISTALSPRAIGHTAGLANAVAFCDPERDLTIAVYFNGVSLSSDERDFCRTALIDGVVRRLESR
jgi:CubicO group peptidase (beta-lactamase class C family)